MRSLRSLPLLALLFAACGPSSTTSEGGKPKDALAGGSGDGATGGNVGRSEAGIGASTRDTHGGVDAEAQGEDGPGSNPEPDGALDEEPDLAGPEPDASPPRDRAQGSDLSTVSMDARAPDTVSPDTVPAEAGALLDGSADVPQVLDASGDLGATDLPLLTLDAADALDADSPFDGAADGTLDVLADAPADMAPDAADDGPAASVDAPDPDAAADLAVDAPPDLPPDASVAGSVVFSELMYHPVEENDYEDQHEYVELYNKAGVALDLSGYKLAGEVTFTFPSGTFIPAGGYLVVAKNKVALLAVTAYGLSASGVVGDWTGQLDNGGGTLRLTDSGGGVIDELTWDDRFPWPVAADAFGAGASWLAPGLLPLSNHQYRGVSLERASYAHPTSTASNWLPSPVDAPTPGRANTVTGTPPPIVEILSAIPSGGGTLIRNSDMVTIRAGFSAYGTVTNVQLEYFVEDLERTDETKTTVAMTQNGGVWDAILPPQTDNKIVRYRVLANKGSGVEVISPRPSDPYAWHSYFVSPVISSSQPPYQLFIGSAAWGRLWTNINFPTDERRVIKETISSTDYTCKVRPSWDADEPAVFVYQGVVYDVHVRYQGSRYQRGNGNDIDLGKTVINPLPNPTFPNGTLRALSWNVGFPRYRRFEGTRATVIVNKLNQSCPGLDQAVGERLYGAAGVPVWRSRYRRLYVNGGYYAYEIDVEPLDSDVIKRTTPPGTRVGDLFKAAGLAGTEGPWGQGDFRVLGINCSTYPNPMVPGPPWNPLDRYAYTYERKTWDWKDNSDLKTFIDGLDTARVAGNLNDTDWTNDNLTPVRTFLDQNVDVETMLNYVAIREWSEPWDDTFHNQFVYRHATGKWTILPWDLDREFGEYWGWNARKSFYLGENNNPQNNGTNWNRLKDAFIRAYRSELNARLVYLSTYDAASTDPKKGILSPTRFRAAVGEAAASFDSGDWSASPVTNLCNFDSEKTSMEAFGDNRYAALINDGLCPVAFCGLKGEYYDDLSFNMGMRRGPRLDPWIEYDWGSGNPGYSMGNDTFQIRWTGKIVPRYSEAYTFYLNADDGVRLWVNGTQIIDSWSNGSSERTSSTVMLAADTPVDIVVEYYENSGNAKVSLSWSSASQAKQIVPHGRLRPP